MPRPTTTNFGLKKGLSNDPQHTCGLDEIIGPIMDANLDIIDAHMGASGGSAPGSKMLYVDGNRTDTYPANGSVGQPFKTISAAVAQVIANNDGARYVIQINPGTYNENVNFGNAAIGTIAFVGVMPGGAGVAAVLISDITATTNTAQINANFYGVKITNSMTLTDDGGNGTFTVNLNSCYVNCNNPQAVNVNGATVQLKSCYWNSNSLFSGANGFFWAFNSNIALGAIALQGGAGIQLEAGTVWTTDPVTIPSGSTMWIYSGSRVTGLPTITVQSGGALEVRDAAVRGTVTVNSGGTATLRNAWILTLNNSGTLALDGVIAAGKQILGAAAPTVAANQVGLGATTAATATAGAATLPANPLGFLIANVGGTTVKIPYYNN